MKDSLPKAILLDLDDTILLFDSVSGEVWRQVCEQFVDRLNGASPGELFEAIQDYRQWFWSDPARHRQGRLDLKAAWRHVAEEGFKRLGIDSPPVLDEFARAYATKREAAIQPLPGAVEALEAFKRKGVRLAMVTNGGGEQQQRKINRFGLSRFFDALVIEGEFGAGKPDPRVFHFALEKLGSTPAEAWMVGDNLEYDIAGAQGVGIHAIWVDTDGAGLPDSSSVRPDRIIGSLAELA